MMRLRLFSLGLVTLLPCAIVISATEDKTIVQSRLEATKRLIPLQKVTVGPDDQYSAAINSSGQWIVFTHKSDLVSHLRIQGAASGDAVDLLPLTADSQEPSFGPSGRLAFSYYKNNARGDVCWSKEPVAAARPLAENDIRCLDRGADDQDDERSNPFWVAESEIGFVSRPILGQAGGQFRKIKAQNLVTGKTRTLAEGRVWAPAMKASGRWLVFNEFIGGSTGERRVITLLEMTTGRRVPILFALPGFPGFPAVSEDETFVYFSHYLNDTNSDNVIDGGDNSVIFRIPIAKVLESAKTEIFPEQLTSVESSCSYPRPFRDRVYATCAFHGSLDVYLLPAAGTVPTAWGEATIQSALQTSRSYQDRVLLLNSLRYRAPARAQALNEITLNNLILGDDPSAALYYVTQAERAGGDRDYWTELRIYLEARQLKKIQPAEAPSREFQHAILAKDAALTRIKGGSRSFQATVRGLLRLFIGQRAAAIRFLIEAKNGADLPVAHPLSRALWFELAKGALAVASGAPDSSALDDAFAKMASASDLGEEARIYYAFEFLKSAEALAPTARLARIASFKKKLGEATEASQARDLVTAEELSLRLAAANEDKTRRAEYQPLDQLMYKTQHNYFLRRAIYVRSILCLAAAAQFDYLGKVATTWMRYTAMDDTEFIYARESFSQASLDQAYDRLSRNQLLLASNYFYESALMTDDLQSHDGYVRTMLKKGERKLIDDFYADMQKRGFIADNMKFVKASLILADHSLDGPGAVGVLTDAIDLLASMKQDRESPIRRLLLGYCELLKLLRTSSGLDFDAKLFEDANRDLMLAYEVGRDDERIVASALIDLGILHERVQNPSLAARFFALRAQYGFLNPQEKSAFTSLRAHALYKSRQPDAAAVVLAGPDLSLPDREHYAFYLMAAGHYAEAALAYEKFLKDATPQSGANGAKISLSYGFTLFKLSRPVEARARLAEAAKLASGLKRIKKQGDRVIDFEPKRIELAAQGLLGQIGSSSDRETALTARARIMADAPNVLDEAESAELQNRAVLAHLIAAENPARALKILGDGLKSANALGKDKGYFSKAIYQTAFNYMAVVLLVPSDDGASNRYSAYSSELNRLVDGCLHAFDALKVPAPFLDLERTKLTMLWAAYRANQGLSPAADAAHAIDDAMTAPAAARAKAALTPAEWSATIKLAAALKH